MLVQGFDLKKNAYNNRFQPYIAYWGAFWNIVFILINGFKVFFKWNVSDFLTSCEYRDIQCSSVFWPNFVRYQYSHLPGIISILENLEADVVLESGGNGPCHGNAIWYTGGYCIWPGYREYPQWKKPKHQKSLQGISGKRSQPRSFSLINVFFFRQISLRIVWN